MCARLPYLLRPSNKPQTSNRGKRWHGIRWKGYSWETPERWQATRLSRWNCWTTYAKFRFDKIAATREVTLPQRTSLFVGSFQVVTTRKGRKIIKKEAEAIRKRIKDQRCVTRRVKVNLFCPDPGPGSRNNRFVSRDLSRKWNFWPVVLRPVQTARAYIQLIEPINLISNSFNFALSTSLKMPTNSYAISVVGNYSV